MRISKLSLLLRLDERGTTPVEYALIVGLISVLLIAWASHLGNTVGGTFNSVSNTLNVER